MQSNIVVLMITGNRHSTCRSHPLLSIHSVHGHSKMTTVCWLLHRMLQTVKLLQLMAGGSRQLVEREWQPRWHLMCLLLIKVGRLSR